MNPFNNCISGKTKLKMVLKSDCLKSKKFVFNINTEEQEDLHKLFDEIKDVIKKYNKS